MSSILVTHTKKNDLVLQQLHRAAIRRIQETDCLLYKRRLKKSVLCSLVKARQLGMLLLSTNIADGLAKHQDKKKG